MASVFSHTAVPVGLAIAAGSKRIPPRVLVLGMVFAALPDIDSLGYAYGVEYGSAFGHRGFTHSLFMAAVAAFIAMFFARRLKARPLTVFLFAFLSMASHGLLDSLTTAGRGVAFFWPWDSSRYMLPWRLIEVSPISFRRLTPEKIMRIMKSELLTVWLPILGAAFAIRLLRR